MKLVDLVTTSPSLRIFESASQQNQRDHIIVDHIHMAPSIKQRLAPMLQERLTADNNTTYSGNQTGIFGTTLHEGTHNGFSQNQESEWCQAGIIEHFEKMSCFHGNHC